MKKLFTLVFLFCGISSLYGQRVPNIALTISAEHEIWTKGSPATVNISIENRSSEQVALPSDTSFRIDDGTRGEDSPTMRNGAYYAPFSFYKDYSSNVGRCKNDLDETNVKREGPIITFYRDDTALDVRAGEKKAFRGNLAGLCWAHQISSIYPVSEVFSVAKKGGYTLYFLMRFRTGTKIQDGMSIPISTSIKSNELRVNIK